MPPITYSFNDMPAFSAALGSFHVKSSSTSVVNSLTTVRFTVCLNCHLPSLDALMVSSLGARWYPTTGIGRCRFHAPCIHREFRFRSLPGRRQPVFRARPRGRSGNDSALTTPLKSPCTTSSAFAAAICTGRVSVASACEGLGMIHLEFRRSSLPPWRRYAHSRACSPPRSPRGASGCEDSCNESSATSRQYSHRRGGRHRLGSGLTHFSSSVLNWRCVGILDVGQTGSRNRGNDATDENNRSA